MPNAILTDLVRYLKEFILEERIIRYLLPGVKSKPRFEISDKIVNFLDEMESIDSGLKIEFFSQYWGADKTDITSILKPHYSEMFIWTLDPRTQSRGHYFWGNCFKKGKGREIVAVYSEDPEISYPIVAAANNKEYCLEYFMRINDVLNFARERKETK